MSDSTPGLRRVSTFLCHAPTKSTTVLPGDYITRKFQDNETVVLEPRVDSQSASAGQWPPVQLTSVIGDKFKLRAILQTLFS